MLIIKLLLTVYFYYTFMSCSHVIYAMTQYNSLHVIITQLMASKRGIAIILKVLWRISLFCPLRDQQTHFELNHFIYTHGHNGCHPPPKLIICCNYSSKFHKSTFTQT